MTTIKPSISWEEYTRLRGEFDEWFKSPEFEEWLIEQACDQQGLCYYCRCDLDGMRVVAEHCLPISAGGDNDRSNLVVSCTPCNALKGSKVLERSRAPFIVEVNDRAWLENNGYYLTLVYGDPLDPEGLRKFYLSSEDVPRWIEAIQSCELLYHERH